MPGSPQWNTGVGKRPRAFPEWRGGPSEASHARASCDGDAARFQPMIPSEERSAAVGELWWCCGQCQGTGRSPYTAQFSALLFSVFHLNCDYV